MEKVKHTKTQGNEVAGVPKRTVSRKAVDKFEVLSGIYLLFMLLIVLVTAMAGDHAIFLVVVGFFPTILVVLISLTMHEQYINENRFLWILPVIIVAIFYFVGQTSPGISENFDVGVLTGINFILSIIYVLFVFGTFRRHITTQVVEKEKAVEEKKSIEEYVHSIEDKSKALNFVVGRVYNKYHGGTDDMRNKLRIPSDWYNEFSLIGVGTEQINFEKLDELISRFELQLKNFEKTELELFKSRTNSLKNLIRNIDGSEKIIDVLDHNDKDPVRSYYKGAVEFCKKIREAMDEQRLHLVKNTYIPKSEDEEKEIKTVNKPSHNLPQPKPKKVPHPKPVQESSTTNQEEDEKDSVSGPVHP